MSDSRNLLDKDKLREKRTEAGLTRPALAARTELHETHIYLLETGRRGTTLKTLRLLARALDCDPAELMPDEAAA
jgi:transcriptional regulator with XRE-family HTH domain